jgi:hypothetical protein
MATREAIIKALVVRLRYGDGSRALRGEILDTVCGLTGYHRDYAHCALRAAGEPAPGAGTGPAHTDVRRESRCGAGETLDSVERPGGQAAGPDAGRVGPAAAPPRRTGPRRHGVPAGRDTGGHDRPEAGRRPADDAPHERSHTKPESILTPKTARRTWAGHDENTPGFTEIDLVGHEDGSPRGRLCSTPTVTDSATDRTENRTVADQRQARALTALTNADTHQPFPIRDIDANNGSELLNQQFLPTPATTT